MGLLHHLLAALEEQHLLAVQLAQVLLVAWVKAVLTDQQMVILLPVLVDRVWATGATATGIVALYGS